MGINIKKLMGQVIIDPSSKEAQQKNVSLMLLQWIESLIQEHTHHSINKDSVWMR